jgi:hypothetical protein
MKCYDCKELPTEKRNLKQVAVKWIQIRRRIEICMREKILHFEMNLLNSMFSWQLWRHIFSRIFCWTEKKIANNVLLNFNLVYSFAVNHDLQSLHIQCKQYLGVLFCQLSFCLNVQMIILNFFKLQNLCTKF